MAAPVREGEILAGKYRVERLLGQGGMGVVVAARHVELDELVALKFLLPEALGEPEAVARFLKEARAAVRIKSEHVARVHDVGQLETGAPYIVMEYLEGSDLAAVIRERGALPIEDVVDYLAQACEAVANAHAMGIVHRDLKPSNLMLVRGNDGAECIKVLDFGISKVTSLRGEDGSMNMTRSATVLGSPLYMSPEQMMSPRDVDGRTDIWALGTIIYELLTARVPFEAETLPAISVLIATTDPVPLREHRPDVPPALAAVAARCMAKKRDDRFADVGELAAALMPFAPVRSRVSIDRAARIVQAGNPSSRFEKTPSRAQPATAVRALTPPGSRPGPPGRSTPGSSGSDLNRTATVGHLGPIATASNWAGAASAVKTRRRVAVTMILVTAAAAIVAFLVLRRDSGGPMPAAAGALPSSPLAPASPAVPAVPAAHAEPAVPALHPEPAATILAVAPEAGAAVEGPEETPAAPRRLRPSTTVARPSPTRTPQTAPATEKKSAYDDM
jgi:eukaryotic-like serine/threonine-protein kinase